MFSAFKKKQNINPYYSSAASTVPIKRPDPIRGVTADTFLQSQKSRSRSPPATKDTKEHRDLTPSPPPNPPKKQRGRKKKTEKDQL